MEICGKTLLTWLGVLPLFFSRPRILTPGVVCTLAETQKNGHLWTWQQKWMGAFCPMNDILLITGLEILSPCFSKSWKQKEPC